MTTPDSLWLIPRKVLLTLILRIQHIMAQRTTMPLDLPFPHSFFLRWTFQLLRVFMSAMHCFMGVTRLYTCLEPLSNN
jgi:hypothetical protein